MHKNKLEIKVIDNGIGIKEEDAMKIFKPYTTLQEAKDMNAAGAGLGLYVCRKLCKFLDGSCKMISWSGMDPKIYGKTVFLVKVRIEVDPLVELRATNTRSTAAFMQVELRSKIFIYEHSVFNYYGMKNILYDQMKL